jgi:hypothetical protein
MQFIERTLVYLGFVISRDGLKMDQEKVKGYNKLAYPKEYFRGMELSWFGKFL